MAYTLNIYYAQEKIGELNQQATSGLLQLSYSEHWQQNGFALSPALSLSNDCDATCVYNFLDNLLPEGQARQLLAQNLGVGERQVFPQIGVLGNDLSGAITFSITDPIQTSPQFRQISHQEMIKRLNQKQGFGLLHWDQKPRLSVAGVQDKLNIFINRNNDIGFGDGGLCSTHILKFEKENTPNLVLNEYVCMKLSLAVGLPTATVKFIRFGQHPALMVSRFDRKYDDKQHKVLRRHVIDGCQALNIARDHKYERNLGDGKDVKHIRDGASLSKLFRFCRTTPNPIDNIQWLIHWQLFNLMISNYDSHGKNLSFYFGKSICRFTPSYDLVNVAMFEQFKHVLAMGMGDEFDPNCIFAYQLADFAETCHIDKRVPKPQQPMATGTVKFIFLGLSPPMAQTNNEQRQIGLHITRTAAHLAKTFATTRTDSDW